MIDLKTCEFAIGTSLLDKVPLFVRGISPPTSFDYQPFSEIIDVGEGYGIRHGNASATYTWVNPDSRTVYNLKRLVDNALNNDRVFYITIPINDGSVIGRTFGDFTGTVHPIDPEEQGVMFGEGVVYNAITLFVNNLTFSDRVLSTTCPTKRETIAGSGYLPPTGTLPNQTTFVSEYNSHTGYYEIIFELESNYCVTIDNGVYTPVESHEKCENDIMVTSDDSCIQRFVAYSEIPFTTVITFVETTIDCVCHHNFDCLPAHEVVSLDNVTLVKDASQCTNIVVDNVTFVDNRMTLEFHTTAPLCTSGYYKLYFLSGFTDIRTWLLEDIEFVGDGGITVGGEQLDSGYSGGDLYSLTWTDWRACLNSKGYKEVVGSAGIYIQVNSVPSSARYYTLSATVYGIRSL